jgi:hypothetical protein
LRLILCHDNARFLGFAGDRAKKPAYATNRYSVQSGNCGSHERGRCHRRYDGTWYARTDGPRNRPGGGDVSGRWPAHLCRCGHLRPPRCARCRRVPTHVQRAPNARDRGDRGGIRRAGEKRRGRRGRHQCRYGGDGHRGRDAE